MWCISLTIWKFYIHCIWYAAYMFLLFLKLKYCIIEQKSSVIHKLYFFFNLSTCLCLYAKNIYNNNNYEYVYFGRYSVKFVYKFIQILTIYRFSEDQLVHKCSHNCKIYWGKQDKEWQTKDCISVLRNSYLSQKHK